jgi:hypothetical protein
LALTELTLVLVACHLPFSAWPNTLGTTMPAMMPSSMITASSSTRLKPRTRPERNFDCFA